MDITIEALGFAAGRVHRVADLAREFPDDSATVERLTADGFDLYLRSDDTVATMGGAALRQSLAALDVAPDQIDAVIMTTDSLWDSEVLPSTMLEPEEQLRFRYGLLHSLTTAGITQACVYANWMSACANALSSLTLARSLVASNQHRNVLVVVADRCSKLRPRLMKRDAGVFSDAAASFLVRRGSAGYRLGHLVTESHLPLVETGIEGFVAHGLQMIRVLESWQEKIAQSGARPWSDYAFVIADNLSLQYLEFFCSCIGLGSERLSFPSKAAIGHAFSLDWLFSLDALSRSGQLKRGDVVAILNFGPASFYFAEFEVL